MVSERLTSSFAPSLLGFVLADRAPLVAGLADLGIRAFERNTLHLATRALRTGLLGRSCGGSRRSRGSGSSRRLAVRSRCLTAASFVSLTSRYGAVCDLMLDLLVDGVVAARIRALSEEFVQGGGAAHDLMSECKDSSRQEDAYSGKKLSAGS